nr:pyridoxal phosphate-dependent transferase, major region, subdomain 1 [Tanacetum cinerariifolium]
LRTDGLGATTRLVQAAERLRRTGLARAAQATLGAAEPAGAKPPVSLATSVALVFVLLPPEPIALLDLAAEHAPYQAELDAAWQAMVQEAAFIQGPAVGQFAAELGAQLGGAHVIPCANGTDALTLSLMSLNLPAGAEVIVPAFTYVATLEAAALLGLRPVLVDVLPDTFNIDPAAVRAALTPRTGAVVAVHL